MRLICTSNTHKGNAVRFELFVPIWCLMTNFNLSTLFTTSTNQCYFKLCFLHPRVTSVFDREIPYWGVRKPWSWYLLCCTQAGCLCTSHSPSLDLSLSVKWRGWAGDLLGYLFIYHPMNLISKLDIWLALSGVFTNALPSWIWHVEILDSINLIKLFKGRPLMKSLYD